MADSRYQRMQGRYTHAATQRGRGGELHPAGNARHSRGDSSRSFSPPRCSRRIELQLERLMRYKPHTLSRGEEKLLAMQSEMAARGRQDVPPAHRRRPEVRHDAATRRANESSSRTRRSRCSCTRPTATCAARRFTSTTSSSRATRTRSTATLLELGAEGRLLREGPQLPERPRGVAVPRQRAGRASTTI